MRCAISLLISIIAFGMAVACSSSSSTPSPKPASTVDCNAQPPSPGSQLKCGGLCMAHDACSDAGEVCPAGFIADGTGTCPNQALCCLYADAGADAQNDAAEDAPGDGSNADH